MRQPTSIIQVLFIYIFIIFLIIITVGAFLYKAEFCMVRYGDRAVLLPQNIINLILGLGTSVLSLFIFWKATEKYHVYKLIKNGWPLLVLNVLLQLVVILFFRIKLTADWEVIWNIAKNLINNDFSAFQKGGYLFAYPHNFGLTFYFNLLDSLSFDNLLLPRILNVLYTLLSLILINLVFCELGHNNPSHRGKFLIFTTLFLPPVFMVNLVYNEVISTFFYLGGIYLSLKFIHTQKIYFLIAIAAFLSLGQFFRSIGYIFTAALITYFILMRINLKKIILFALFITIGFTSPLVLTNRLLYSLGKTEEALGKNSVPSTKWLHIGLDREYFGYWDQGLSYRLYAWDASWDKTDANAIFIEGIRQRLQEYGRTGVAEIYFKKTVWLWTEGTYQSVYAGMSHSYPGGYLTETPVSKYFEQDLQRRDIFKAPMYHTNLLFLLINLCFFGYVAIYRKWSLVRKEMLLVLILLGFISFYLFWEVKPRYIFPTYPCLTLLTFSSIVKLTELKIFKRN